MAMGGRNTEARRRPCLGAPTKRSLRPRHFTTDIRTWIQTRIGFPPMAIVEVYREYPLRLSARHGRR